MLSNKYYILFSTSLSFTLLLLFSACHPKSDVCENAQELVQEAKSQIVEISAEQYLQEYHGSEKDYLLLDVRQGKEYDEENIEGSICLPRGVLEFKINNATFWEDQMMYAPNDTSEIIIYCKKGSRGALATVALNELGYKNVKNLSGGFSAYQEKQQKAEDN